MFTFEENIGFNRLKLVWIKEMVPVSLQSHAFQDTERFSCFFLVARG